jgi:hypothetical protein
MLTSPFSKNKFHDKINPLYLRESLILELSDRFKANYLRNVGDDIPKIEFYPARADAGRKVRITKVYTVI